MRLPRRDFWRICVPTVCPVVLVLIHCRSNMWNCLECVHFIPEKEQLSYFEEQEKAWRDKAEKFKDYSIMEANFSEISDRFQQIIQKMRKEEPTP